MNPNPYQSPRLLHEPKPPPVGPPGYWGLRLAAASLMLILAVSIVLNDQRLKMKNERLQREYQRTKRLNDQMERVSDDLDKLVQDMIEEENARKRGMGGDTDLLRGP